MKITLLMTTFICLTACQNEPSKKEPEKAITNHEIPISQLYSSNQCLNELKHAGVIQVTSLAHWNQLFTPKIQSTYPAKTAPKIDVDFSKQTVIVISRGQQENTAYSVTLNESKAYLNNQALTLNIELGEPKPEMNYAQTLITPCLAVTFDNQAEIETLTVLSKSWKQQLKLDI